MVRSGASELQAIGVLPIHFDVPGDYLPLDTFIETSRQTRAIAEGFNRALFGDRLRYDVFVLPPEEGSFKSKLGFWILAGSAGFVWAFVESDIGKAFIRGLTDHEPAYWSEIVGSEIRRKLESMDGSHVQPEVDVEELRRRKFENVILVESMRSFLLKDLDELRRIGVDERQFRDAFEARNRFFEACAADQQVRALGFDETENFPIKRGDFVRLHVALPPKEEEEPVPERWAASVDVVHVTSPNWDRHDIQRPWKGRDLRGRERFFRIEDEDFWALVEARGFDPHIADTMKVQWAYRVDLPKQRTYRVLRVLEYNGQHFSNPLDEVALATVLGPFEPGGPTDNLFHWFD